METTVIILLVLFQIKHFVADYPLQNAYMLGKFKLVGWERPLAAHAAVHALFTFAIALFFNPILALPLAIFDFAIHGFVDRLKAHPELGGRFKPEQPQFWWALGADQTMHHLTHYAIIFLIVTL